MIIEPTGGWLVAAGFLAASVILIFVVVRAAGWGGRKAISSATGTQSTGPTPSPTAPPAPTPPPPAGNSGGEGAKSAMKVPWGWLQFAALVLLVIFVWQYAWPQWIKPLLDEHVLLRPQVTGTTTRSASTSRNEVVVYHRQVPDGGTVVAPSEPGAWSESITYQPGLRLCTVEQFGAESVAAEMKILGSDGWFNQTSLSRYQLRRVDQIRFRSLNGASQNVTYSFVPEAERC